MESSSPEIPKPTDTGSAGTQNAAATDSAAPSALAPFEGLPISRRVEGLAASRPRSMGGEVAAGLIAGSFTQLSQELTDARDDLKTTRSHIRELNDALLECRERAAVLAERVKSFARDRHLRNLCIVVGTALVGLGLDLLRSTLKMPGWICISSGAVLLIFGWFFGPKEDDK